jgi:small subunit ribosomal protein S17
MSAKKLTGKIVSDKMQKTVVVAVEMHKKHPIYSKIVKNTRRFKARNDSDAKLNDVVVIEECKPFSKDVSWKVVGKVMEK